MHVTSPQRVVRPETARESLYVGVHSRGRTESEARLNRLPLKYLRELIVDACVAGKPPTEAGIEAALRRHIAEQQAQTTCCGRCCGCTCGWA